MSWGENFFPRTLYITGESCYSGHNRNRGGSGKEGKMKTYKVPGTFYSDHLGRHHSEGVWSDYDMNTERWAGRYVHVTLTEDQFEELLSDAEFYADGGGGLDSQYAGLIKSAQATVRHLEGSA